MEYGIWNMEWEIPASANSFLASPVRHSKVTSSDAVSLNEYLVLRSAGISWDPLRSPGISWDLLNALRKGIFFPLPVFPDFCFQRNLGKTGYDEILVFRAQLGREGRIFSDHKFCLDCFTPCSSHTIFPRYKVNVVLKQRAFAHWRIRAGTFPIPLEEK